MRFRRLPRRTRATNANRPGPLSLRPPFLLAEAISTGSAAPNSSELAGRVLGAAAGAASPSPSLGRTHGRALKVLPLSRRKGGGKEFMGNCICRRKANIADTAAGIFAIQIDRVHETEKNIHEFSEPPVLPSEKFHKLPEPSSPDPPRQWKDASTTVNSVVNEPVIHKDVEDLRQMAGYGHVDIFTYDELRRATSNFRPDLILGEGGFGLVYKGVIDNNVRPGFNATVVAVKELNPDGYQGDKEWLAEINYLGQLSHQNLVKLIGYCCEDEHRLLVYEYMACGSLEKHLFRRTTRMPWLTRLKVALDAARGLAFLHGAKTPIIYRDFKTSNILLDAEFNGKLSDFGLAKEGPIGEQTHVSTRVMGTYGYAAPEYIMTGHLTAKSDVYGYGVVLLEMLIGRRANDNGTSDQEDNLVDWARPLLIRFNKLLRIMDPRMGGQYSDDGAEKVAKLAYDCLSQNPKSRPTMSEVVDALDGVLEAEKDVAPDRPLRDRVADRSHAGRAGREGEDYDMRTKPPRGRSASEDTIPRTPKRASARKEFNQYTSYPE